MSNEAPRVAGEYLMVRYAVLNLDSQRVETSTRKDHPEDVFVLNPLKDPAARKALRLYADECYPELGAEIHEWLDCVERRREEWPTAPGSVGGLNHEKRSGSEG